MGAGEADLTFFNQRCIFLFGEGKPPALAFYDLPTHTDKVNYLPWLNDFP